MTLPYRLKEPIKIVNEVDLILKLLQTDLRNHRLKHVIPYENMLKEQPDIWKNLPGMFIRKVDDVDLINRESLGEDYDTGLEKIGNIWQADIMIDLVAHVKQIFNYPPIETDGDDEDNRYEHAKNCLPVMQKILHTILSENRSFADPDDLTFQWDTIQKIPGENLIPGGYGRGAPRDVWAIQVLYRFRFEMEVD